MSEIQNCATCGREIGLRVMRVSFNRARGVAQWLEPRQGENCPCLKAWSWVKMKSDKSKPSPCDLKISEWNAHQAPSGATPTKPENKEQT